ncbi:MAG: ATP-dependent DNA helicase RecG [Phycisphaerales bacterium]|nr:ATP-dependent DNA helicase RecG [Planctomycetota bacterium]
MPAPRSFTLATPIDQLEGVPARAVPGLRQLGITNLGKLIAHLPLRHERLEAEAPVAELQADRIVSARGEITATRTNPRRPRPRFEAVLMDGTTRLDLVWFNALYLRDKIKPGMRLRVQGKTKRYGPGLQIANPKFEILSEQAEPASTAERVRPVYPASERIKSQTIEKIIEANLPRALPLLTDHLPPALLERRNLPSLGRAYEMVHHPQNADDALRGLRRLAYDELLLLQLGVHMKRAHLREQLKAPAFVRNSEIDRRIRARLPFRLTPSQDAAIDEITADLCRTTPTNRLLQGDVGSGKTAVALYAMLLAVAAGHQAALMAPTELLAEQHHATVRSLLHDSKVEIRYLGSSLDEADRARSLKDSESGRAAIVIGTHALLQETVRFRSLGLAVIDEQHRFGVHQRAALRQKAADARTTPHVIVMTATPIPRTLALTMFGDLDVSVIHGMPPGRSPIQTRIVPRTRRDEVYEFVRQRLQKEEQAFVVVPAINSRETETGDSVRTVTGVRELVRELELGALRGIPIASLHGRMSAAERTATMMRFRSGQIRCLVATTIVEVGVDVPDATLMVIEHAGNFGLAQLHQLRGRVGRGSKPGVCLLIADEDDPDSPNTTARGRLDLLASTNDGFALAEGDWQMRGSGGFFDERQSGLSTLRVADLIRDRDLLELARRDAREWIAKSPALADPAEALVLRRLLKTFGTQLGLVAVG